MSATAASWNTINKSKPLYFYITQKLSGPVFFSQIQDCEVSWEFGVFFFNVILELLLSFTMKWEVVWERYSGIRKRRPAKKCLFSYVGSKKQHGLSVTGWDGQPEDNEQMGSEGQIRVIISMGGGTGGVGTKPGTDNGWF